MAVMMRYWMHAEEEEEQEEEGPADAPGEAAMLLRAYVGAVQVHLADADRGAGREAIVELLVMAHAPDAAALDDVREIFAASKTLLRRPLAACRELAACAIGGVARAVAAAGDHDGELLQHVIESLSMAAADTSVSVRCRARAGLACVPGRGTPAQTNAHVVGLLSGCCDDESDDGVVAGLGGIAGVFEGLFGEGAAGGADDADCFASLSPLQTAMRVRGCFGSADARVREAALSTFETIVRAALRASAAGAEGWRSLVHDSLTKAVLLLNDGGSAGVRRAAKSLLRRCARVLEGGADAPLADLVAGPGFDADKRLRYATFLGSLARVVCERYADEVDGYLRHVMDDCRRGSPTESSALLLGAHLLSRRVALGEGGGRGAAGSFSDLLLARLDAGGGGGVDAETRTAAAEALSVLMVDV